MIVLSSVEYIGEYALGYEFHFPPGSAEPPALPISRFVVYGTAGTAAECASSMAVYQGDINNTQSINITDAVYWYKVISDAVA